MLFETGQVEMNDFMAKASELDNPSMFHDPNRLRYVVISVDTAGGGFESEEAFIVWLVSGDQFALFNSGSCCKTPGLLERTFRQRTQNGLYILNHSVGICGLKMESLSKFSRFASGDHSAGETQFVCHARVGGCVRQLYAIFHTLCHAWTNFGLFAVPYQSWFRCYCSRGVS